MKDIYVYVDDRVKVNDPIDLFDAVEDGAYEYSLEKAEKQVEENQEEHPHTQFVIYKLSIELVK